MIRRKKENIEWLEFELLQNFPEVVHRVFLRALNFQEKKVWQQAFSTMGIDRWVRAKIIHSDRVLLETETGECDGLVTKENRFGLGISHADCQAAIFYDPVKKAIANVHCGWRGNVKNIYQKTVEKMEKEFSTRPEDLLVCISPSLGPENAEFIHYEKELPKSFLPFQIKPVYFDFWEISKWQLQKAGVLEKNIEIARICTFSEKGDFFSYRRDKKTGRHGTVVALNLSDQVSKGKRKRTS